MIARRSDSNAGGFSGAAVNVRKESAIDPMYLRWTSWPVQLRPEWTEWPIPREAPQVIRITGESSIAEDERAQVEGDRNPCNDFAADLVWWSRNGEPLKFTGDAKMAAISVEVPHDLREFIDANVRHGKFVSANDYIVALVESARDGRSAIEIVRILHGARPLAQAVSLILAACWRVLQANWPCAILA